jgi:GT2 family glycosyltransferase/lipopolysaccharide/colanic/teichoic acid biosynthesis glycosyltransferase
MKLSVIIVNYNVKYFIEQAVYAVQNALKNIHAEIIVVDNNSSDGSVEMIQQKFPDVIVIANTDNKGFSTANNQGIKISKGEYILLLNPDTVVQEDTFEKTIRFMDEHPDAGALGVKMIDGKGNFLPESKRGLPTPIVAFYKTFGLSSLFPKSKIFNRYHLGYLNEDEIHEVDVLAGAFMLLRKTVLDKIGLLDEDFFMYGEDIDLSYRVSKAGYKNYYFPETRIIHYKGESTRKGSLNYVLIFYQAMIIFAQKHYSPQQAKFYTFFIRTAVYFRAFLAFINRVTKLFFIPAADTALLFGGMYWLKNFWASNIKNAAEYYPVEYTLYVIPAYILVWLLSVYFNGGYDLPLKNYRIVRGLLAGSVIIAAFYAFLPESLRFSRAMILLGTIWAVFSMISFRILLKIILKRKIIIEEKTIPKIIIAGSGTEGKRALGLLTEAGVNHRFLGFVSPENNTEKNVNTLGNLGEFDDIKSLYQPDEIIFCSKDVAHQEIIGWITRLGASLNYKIIPENSMSIIGSNSKNTAGDLYAIDINLNIASPMSQRNKRLFDILVCFILMVFSPIVIFIIKQPLGLFINIISVLSGTKSWVGYQKISAISSNIILPKIKPGILTPLNAHALKAYSDNTISRLNLLYAKDYEVAKDLEIVWKGIKFLGKTDNNFSIV